MSMKYIRETYGVPAKRGGRVEYAGMPGRIVGARGAYLRIKLENALGERPINYHPTFQMKYM